MPIHSGSRVFFLGLARREMDDQPESIQADFARLERIIENEGLHKLSSRQKKQVQGDIWELRLTGKDTIARALYLKVVGRRVMILLVFTKKGPKDLRRHIKTALKRAKEVRNA